MMKDEAFTNQLERFIESDDKFKVLVQQGKPKESIFVLDSSFNPPHYGHLELLKRSITANAHVILIVSVNNADKKPAPASFDQRLGMMNQFVQYLNKTLDVSYSICISKSPRFVDKSIEIEGVFDGRMTYLLGFDTLIRVLDPKYYMPKGIEVELDTFMTTNDFVCLTRDKQIDHQLKYLEDLRDGKLNLPAHWCKGIRLVTNEKENNVISSSEIRERIRDGKGVDDLTLPGVVEYIESHKCYE